MGVAFTVTIHRTPLLSPTAVIHSCTALATGVALTLAGGHHINVLFGGEGEAPHNP